MNWHLILLSYFCAFVFWLELSLGLMGVLMIGRITGGRWFECGESILARSLPALEILAILFLPLVFELQDIYSWASGTNAIHRSTIRETFFLNPVWFRVRALVYWILWLGCARLLRSRAGGRPLWNGLGLLMMLFTCSFAAQDWIMTLDPRWSSTGFGVTFIGSGMIAALAFLTLTVVVRIGRVAPMRDYGNLLLMAVLFWIYVEFLEYLIIWSGQVPREMHWYRLRSIGSYAVALCLVSLIGFAIPLIMLLFRKVKETPASLLAVAGALLLIRWPEAFWLIFPGQNVDTVSAISVTLVMGVVMGLALSVSFLLIPQRPTT